MKQIFWEESMDGKFMIGMTAESWDSISGAPVSS